MSITERRLRHKEEIRSLILDTAWEMVVTEGWQLFSIRKVAEAIEYSITVIYSHFENKDALLLEFIEKGFRLLVEKINSAKIGQEGPKDEIDAMARAYWSFAIDNQQYYQLMFGMGISTSEAVHNISQMSGLKEAITSSINAFTPIGKKPPIDPFLKYQVFLSMMHGLVSINMQIKPFYKYIGPPEQVLNDLIRGFIEGLSTHQHSDLPIFFRRNS